MFHRSRGGVRGGRDQFNWEDVKNDKDRFNYLGNSLKAAVKKPWNQGPETDWYVKGVGEVGVGKAASKAEEEQTELAAIKAKETEYMANVLAKGFGFKTTNQLVLKPNTSVPNGTLSSDSLSRPRVKEEKYEKVEYNSKYNAKKRPDDAVSRERWHYEETDKQVERPKTNYHHDHRYHHHLPSQGDGRNRQRSRSPDVSRHSDRTRSPHHDPHRRFNRR